jgi:hypothetical protein
VEAVRAAAELMIDEDAPMLPWPSYDARDDERTSQNLEKLAGDLTSDESRGAARELALAVFYLEEVRRLADDGATSELPEALPAHRAQLGEQARDLWRRVP